MIKSGQQHKQRMINGCVEPHHAFIQWCDLGVILGDHKNLNWGCISREMSLVGISLQVMRCHSL